MRPTWPRWNTTTRSVRRSIMRSPLRSPGRGYRTDRDAPLPSSMSRVTHRWCAHDLDHTRCKIVGHRANVHARLDGLDGGELGARLRMLGDEQRAAVVVGLDRRLVGADALRASAMVSSLSWPRHGRRIGIVVAAPMTPRFSSVCDATCASASPVASALAPCSARDALGDAHHRAAIEDHREPPVAAGVAQLLLRVGEGHDREAHRRRAASAASCGASARDLVLASFRRCRGTSESRWRRARSRASSSASRRRASRCRPRARARRGR